MPAKKLRDKTKNNMQVTVTNSKKSEGIPKLEGLAQRRR